MDILLVLLLPLLTVLILPIKKISREAFYIAVSLLGILDLYWVCSHLPHSARLDCGFNIVFLVDKYSWFFAILVLLGWVITIIYSYSFIKYNFQQKAKQFHIFLSLIITSVIATGFAGNLMTLFIFYCLNIPFVYPLLIFRDNKESHDAAKYYLRATLLPAFCILLPAIFAIYQLEGYFDFGDTLPPNLINNPILASTLLIMFVIGMSKNCVMPFNAWLPKTMLAPAPISALVHSIATVNTGSIALIKIAIYVFGLDFLHSITSNFFQAGCLTYLCGVTAIYSAYKAITAESLKVRFSHSTVSQLSYIITAILISTKAAILGAVLHIITHSFAKMCLFFIAGFYNCVYGTINVKDLNKILPHTPWLVAAAGACGLSIAGFPLLAGYFSKDLMLLEELHSGNYAAAGFLIMGSIMNLFYIWPLIQNAFFVKEIIPIEKKQVPVGMVVAISSCLILLVSLSFFTYNLIRAFETF